ncbi:MAG: hypothetical protein ABFD07_04225 [Methanobacterium sp.]
MEYKFCCGICSYNKPIPPDPPIQNDPLAWLDHCEFHSDPSKQFIIKDVNEVPDNCPIKNIMVSGNWR